MRGQGRVFQRNGSPFWWIAYYHRGRELREVARHIRTGTKLKVDNTADTNTKGDNRREAERYLKRRLGELAAEQYGGRKFVGPVQERVTIHDLLKSLTADLDTRQKLHARAKCTLKALDNYFGSWRAVNVTTDAVTKFIQQRQQEGYSNATINRWNQLLGQAYRLAIQRKQLSEAPPIPKLSELGNTRKGFFEWVDFDAILKCLPEHLQDFSRFGYITGWRKSAIASLKWENVQNDTIILAAEHSKNREALSVPLVGELKTILDRRRAASLIQSKTRMPWISEHVFHFRGKQIGDFWRTWRAAAKLAGVNGRLFHDLRRTACRNMISAGVPLPVAMSITGHKSLSMFKRYAIVDASLQRKALEATEAHLANSILLRKGAAAIPSRATDTDKTRTIG